MRECLGWVTNCPDEQRCPMNWLEHAVSELPTTVRCHVCDREVHLTTDPDGFKQRVASGVTSAIAVIPCAGAPALDWPQVVVPAESTNENYGGPPSALDPPRSVAPPSSVAPPAAKVLYCTLLSGDTIKCDKDTMIIGRSRTCDIVIPSAKISRQHASLTFANGEWFMEDLGSANGVFREAEKITKTRVKSGDVFTISEETLSFEFR